MVKLKSVLFMGRKNCYYSNKLKTYLKKNSEKFYYFESKKTSEKLNSKYLKYDLDYIFCFRSYYILKKNLINKVKKFAINFHPGPPDYRGMGCVNFALYENSKFYGSTTHLIDEKIDHGKIIDIKKFKLNGKKNVDEILSKTYKIMFNQAIKTINDIIKNPKIIKKKIDKNKKIKWSNKIRTLKDLNKLLKINKNIGTKNFIKKKY